MEKEIQLLISIFVIFIALMIVGIAMNQTKEITNFQECVKAGNPVSESFPRQCQAGDKIFVEQIIQVLEDFGSKIVYVTSYSNISLIEKDCEDRGGFFNQCGNLCAPSAEVCIQICAYTCENISGANILKEKAKEFCGKQNVARVFTCSDFFGVASSLLGGGTKYYLVNGTEVSCPVVSPEYTTQQCREFMKLTENSEILCKDLC